MLIIIPIWSQWSGQRALAQMALPPSTTRVGGGGVNPKIIWWLCNLQIKECSSWWSEIGRRQRVWSWIG